MANTILVTGASSGIGKATVLLFQQRGWNVVATARSLDKTADLAALPNVLCLPLDVTDRQSIRASVEQAIAKFGTLNALVNNAGFGLVGAFEACSEEEIRQQFETNVFGLMAVTRAILPHFRETRQGTIVNIASIGGRIAFPLYSLYNSTKWAVEGFSEALQYELRPFNIKVKIIEPGPIKTDFYGRSMNRAKKADLTVYDAYAEKVLPKIDQNGEFGSPPEVTAEAIYRAVTDGRWRLRYPGGGNASFLLTLRKLLPDGLWTQVMRSLEK
ncbi:SDR family oxidoreductase [Alkalinema sp. FACHB-956]|uniref:SDR family oxidoreductase n=1 Tax=Alkalinema sp. FACHB-956 TaxID=2692768 RepID=UPI001685C62E|nr:SDR family oxidoreductase [Alkalinema sp. FACHB-956]MBD2329128.1 SDR family oxidoreductase [Alkalinema sp. FACHB-956]